MRLPPVVPRPCPVCESCSATPILDHPLTPVAGISLHAGYRVVACAACGLVFADGIPGQEAFDAYYARASRYENNARLGRPGPVDQARYAAIATGLAAALEGLDRSSLRIAEVGTATGGLLAELKCLGFRRLLGIDPSPQCVQAGQRLYGLDMAQGTLFAPLPGGPHDLIIAVGVLEHVRDLDRALAVLDGALAPGGRLYLEVPDLAGFHRTNEAPFQEFSTEHITFFTARSLENLLGRHRFQPDFGGAVDRVHGGGSTMQVLAQAFRKGCGPAAPIPDRDGPAAALAYADLCRRQAAVESQRLARILPKDQPIAIWGAGTVACRLMANGALGATTIAGFVDANPHLQGRTLGGVAIHPPDWLGTFDGPILIASRGYAPEILARIRTGMGLPNPVLSLEPEASAGDTGSRS